MYRYVYKLITTEDPVKDHYYYGKHTTENLNDNYHGSSAKLRKLNYFKNHPNGWRIEIIKMCMSAEEQANLENELIRKYKHEPKCLNGIHTSSSGGDVTNWTEEKRKDIREKKQQTWNSKTEEEKQHYKNMLSELFSGDKNPMYGKNYRDYMTEEAAKRRDEKWYNTMMSKSPEEKAEINKRRGAGGLKLKGRIRISNELCTKWIKPEEFDYYKALGYERGLKKHRHAKNAE